MRRMLEQTFGEFGWPSPTFEPIGWSPLVDIEEQDDAYLIEAELPGVKTEDVDVEVIGHELMINGELKETERKGVLRKRMRPAGRFDYRVALPESVAADKVEAKLSDGVLAIRVPKVETATRKHIQIKS
jgi:HSP20 family protein